MNKAISTRQLMMSVATFIMASSLLTSNLYYFAKTDSWFSVILGFVFSIAIIGMYETLAKRYPGSTLIEINDAVFGCIAGKVVSLLYVFFFYSLAVLNTHIIGGFIKGLILQNTPLTIIYILFIAICAFAVNKGPISLTSYGTIFTIVTILAILFNGSLLLDITHTEYLLPALTLPFKNYFIGALIVTMIPFCEIMSFFMLIPYMRRHEEFGKAMKGGLLIGAVTLLFIVVRDITVLGKYIIVSSQPTFSVLRMIDVGDILTRLEIIYAVVLLSLMFFKVNIVYYATVTGLSKLLRIEPYKYLSHIVGVLIIIYAMFVFESQNEHVKWGQTAAPTYSSLFLLILPLITLIVSAFRSKTRKTDSEYSVDIFES